MGFLEELCIFQSEGYSSLVDAANPKQPAAMFL
jgi:hypothetical protein